jgi:hypothetical protein
MRSELARLIKTVSERLELQLHTLLRKDGDRSLCRTVQERAREPVPSGSATVDAIAAAEVTCNRQNNPRTM